MLGPSLVPPSPKSAQPQNEPTTLVITHDHCALHGTRQISPERPKRLKWVWNALEIFCRDVERGLSLKGPGPVELRNVETSEPMFRALEEQLLTLANAPPTNKPMLQRSFSVGYLEEKILPAVKAVHTQEYIEKLATSCVSLQDKADGTKVELDGDTVVSASSLSAALCAVLSCCYAVDAVCDGSLPYRNAFAVIRPPGHHAGANGPTVSPDVFAEVSAAAAAAAQPARLVTAPPSKSSPKRSNSRTRRSSRATASTALRASACSTMRRSLRGMR